MHRSRRQPGYLHHKASNQAYVRLDGRCRYLGIHGSPESYRRYAALMADYLAGEPIQPVQEIDLRPLSVGELAEQYLRYESHRFGPKNKSTYAARYAMLALTAGHAGLRADRFRPKALKEVQRSLAESGLARSEVNRRINRIRHAFRWGASEELVPETVHAALTAVPGLRRGEARENPPRQAVGATVVEQTANWLESRGSVGAAGLLRLLRWTGCRPCELCAISSSQVDLCHGPPLLRIECHKTRWRTGEDRVVPLNSPALRILREAMDSCPETEAPLFRSRRGVAYTSNGLYQAVRKACRHLGEPAWSPYQLRHLVATEIIAATGNETATAAMLGHSPSSTVVRRYSRNRTLQAVSASLAIGHQDAAAVF